MKAPVVAAVLAVAGAVEAAEPAITARAALIMDAATGEVEWSRNADRPLPPASTTKVLTAIVAIESGRLDERFPVSRLAAGTAPSKINLLPGQRMRLRDLLYAVLLNSANDAASVVAEGLGGSEAGFAARMNQRAAELGARTANFSNPHGLTAHGHVASARDLALVFRHGLGLPLFREILGTRAYRVPVEAQGVRWVSLRSHNRLLSGYQFPVIGKTGYTRAARRCFVGAGRRGERELVIVLLGASDLWGDAKRLFAYGFGTGAERPPVVVARTTKARRPASPPRVPASAEGDEETPSEQPAARRYAVQLGPFDRGTAVATRSRLARRGYTTNLDGGLLRVGSFASRARAQLLAKRLAASGYRGVVVPVR